MLIKDILSGLKVRDLAGADITDLVTAAPGSSIHEAAGKLKENKIGALLVCDADGRLVGVLSERDIVHGVAAAEGDSVLGMSVEALMTRDVVTCEIGDPPHEVMARMSAGGFRHMPVMEGGELRGIISSRDILKHYVENANPDEQATLMRSLTWV